MSPIFYWLSLVVSSILFAAIVYIIDICSEYLSDLRLGYCPIWYLNRMQCSNDFAYGNMAHYVFYSVLFSVIGTLLTTLAPQASGSGIPQVKVILSNVSLPRYLDVKTLIIKAFGLVYGVASGLMLGKEGPLVHIAVALQSQFLADLNLPLLSAAASAGVSCAFGTPIGGVLFSFEEVSHNFNPSIMWKCTLASLISLVTLQFLNPFNNGKSVIFKVNYVNSFHFLEYFIFILLGVCGGYFGRYFIKFNKKRQTMGKTFDQVIILGLLTSASSYFLEFTYISNSELIQVLLQPCHPDLPLCNTSIAVTNLLQLVFAMLLKSLLMVLTFGSLIPSGIFIPSMVIGAICGRILGIVVNLFVTVNSGLYSLIGAAAFLSGTTRMTLSLVVIMFELTNTPYFVIPIMTAILTSKYVGGLYGAGIYDELIKINKYPYLPQLENLKDKTILFRLATQPLSTIMTSADDLNCISPGITISELMRFDLGLVYIVENNNLLGVLDEDAITYICKYYGYAKNTKIVCNNEETLTPDDDAIEMINELNVYQFIKPTFAFDRDTPISICCQVFVKMELDVGCVCYQGRLVGSILKKDLVNYIRSI